MHNSPSHSFSRSHNAKKGTRKRRKFGATISFGWLTGLLAFAIGIHCILVLRTATIATNDYNNKTNHYRSLNVLSSLSLLFSQQNSIGVSPPSLSSVIIEDFHIEDYPPLDSWTSKKKNKQNITISNKSETHSSSSVFATTKSEISTYAVTPNISFCLLIKDDNDILNEWIAYHYHLWNLRKIIVAVDPSSQTSPKEILQVWQTEFGIDFEIWNDERYLPSFFLQGDYDQVPRMIKIEDKNGTKWRSVVESNEASQSQPQPQIHAKDEWEQTYIQINNHRYRQAKFLQHCSKAIQGEVTSTRSSTKTSKKNVNRGDDFDPSNARWMTHIDTDEYMALNPMIRNDPTISNEPGSHIQFLQKSVTEEANMVNWPCISMPRIRYGSEEREENIPHLQDWNLQRFETLRWKYHANYDDHESNKQPKVVMDVTGFPPFNVSRKAFSIHRPNMHLCRKQGQMSVEDDQRYPIVVHHYLGSLERYQARHDPRRTLALYQKAANATSSVRDSNWIDTWLPAFVAQHTPEKLQRVLSEYRKDDVIHGETAFDFFDEKKTALKLGTILPIEEDSVSACLLIKDDNDILGEWIAYHYHVLKLRTLIVAVDPSSTTMPTSVLNPWSELLNFRVWQDEDYMPAFFLDGHWDQIPNLMGNVTNSTTSIYHVNEVDEDKVERELFDINKHRFRQVQFLTTCIRTLKQENKTWMMHIDTDEYVALHPKLRTQNHWRQLTIDPTIRKNSLFTILKHALKDYSKGLSYPCVSMPRLFFGSIENDDEMDRYNHIPSSFNATLFESIRWKHHSNYDEDVMVNGKPKALIDISGLPPTANLLHNSYVYSIHRPSLRLCQSDRDVLFEASHKFPLIAQHYIGSWERYSHREDPRRSREMYNKRARVDAGTDDEWIDGWLKDFINDHGLDMAKRLLSSYKNIDSVSTNIPQKHRSIKKASSNMTKVSSVDKLQNFDPASHMDFSACLLVKDDNEILGEWIAYHYHVLGLRYMIVAVDAKSHTSPTQLLDKWRDFGMTIEEWQDSDFMPEIYFEKSYHLQPRLVKIKKNRHKWLEGIDDPKIKEEYYNSIQDHRFRQITFLSSCSKRLKEFNRTWMIHIDTDEYVVVNPKLRKEGVYAESITIPTRAEVSLIPRLLNEITVNSGKAINYPCISLPRLLYGSIESPRDEAVETLSRDLQDFNLSRFESLRWKYHTSFEDSDLNKQPKVILDVSAIPADDKMFADGRVFSIHRPSQALCRTQGQMFFEDTEYFPFSANHYLGTYERFSARDDIRRNRKLYDQKASVKAGKERDGWVDSWLPNFISRQGREKVASLLQDYIIH